MQAEAFLDIKIPMINIDMSSPKLFQKLLLLGGLWCVQGCDDGAGKPESSLTSDSASCLTTQFRDADGDGFGDPLQSKISCIVEPGWVDNDRDCNDSETRISPGEPERCNGIDDDCNGETDEDTAIDATDWFMDADGDGFGFGPPRGYGCSGGSDEVSNNDDCDQESAEINPLADERCDGVDNDCDGTIDEDGTINGFPFYADTDGDGWGDANDAELLCMATDGRVDTPGDCNDSDPFTHPEAVESCDGHDRDCDGFIDNRCNITVRDTDADRAYIHSDHFILTHMSVGDITGDGIDDLLIGNSHGQQIHLLDSPIDTDPSAPAWTITADKAESGAARSFTSMEDVDSDGIHDLVVAHHTLNEDYYFESEIQVHLGPLLEAPNLNSPDTSLLSLPSESPWAYLFDGIQMADITHDGVPDALFSNEDGNVLVIWPSMLSDGELETDTIQHTIEGRTNDGHFASGDFDGDGGADFVYSSGDPNGIVLVAGPILEAADWGDPDEIVYGSESQQLGKTLVLCDLNLDGKDEIVASTAPIASSGSDAYSGSLSKVLVFDVNESFHTPLQIIESSGDEVFTANCIDVDGDHHADLLVQSPLYDASDAIPNVGAVSLFFGAVDGTMGLGDADRRFRGSTENDYFGWLNEAGDFDGDGIGELIIGLPYEGITIFDSSSWLSSHWEPSAD